MSRSSDQGGDIRAVFHEVGASRPRCVLWLAGRRLTVSRSTVTTGVPWLGAKSVTIAIRAGFAARARRRPAAVSCRLSVPLPAAEKV